MTLLIIGSCSQKEQEVAVSSVSISQSSAEMVIGETLQLKATVLPSTTTEQNVTWASSKKVVATVDKNGIVKAVAEGETVITATAGGKTAVCTIKVKGKLSTSVTVDAVNISAISVVLKGKANLSSSASSDLKVGFQYSKSAGILPSNSIMVEARDADADYNYSTGITGLDPGTKYYYRSFVRQNGKDEYGETKEFKTKDESSVIQTQEASALSAVSVKLNAAVNLTDVICSRMTFGFYWGTSSGSLTGKVTASEGNGAISADLSELSPSQQYYYQAFASLDGKELKSGIKSVTTKDLESLLETIDARSVDAVTFSLNAKLDLTDVKYKDIDYGFYWGPVNDTQEILVKGGNITASVYSAIVTNLSSKTRYWYLAYVKLDSQTFYGEMKTFTTEVVPVTSVSLDITKYTFPPSAIGSTITLNATVLPDNATDKSVEWSTSNSKVATVDSKGVVKAISTGSATITVKTKDQGKKATCKITVAYPVTGITLNQTSLDVVVGDNTTLTATVSPSNAYDKTLNWSSDNTSVVRVDGNGSVKALSKGKAVIMASANDGSGISVKCDILVSNSCPEGGADLGLRNSEGFRLYWAFYNLTSKGFDVHGDYFAWGENSSKKTFTLDNYKWSKNKDYTRYCPSDKTLYWNGSGSPDNKTTFSDYDYEDDAARKILGGNWRIPTDEEWTALRTQCTWVLNSGYATVRASNGEEISLYAGGQINDGRHWNPGVIGYYWSSSLHTMWPSYAWMIIFDNETIRQGYMYRYYGLLIRPVSD